MKKLYTLLAATLVVANLWAQAPSKMTYQAVIRNADSQLITNTQVGMRISILQGDTDGSAVYTETLTPTTNANGLVTVELGGAAGFDAINWANGPYFIKTQTDTDGGTNYTITGTSQLLTVPYALHAKTAESAEETDPIFTAWDKSTGIVITESQITDFGTYIETEADPVFLENIDVTGAAIGDILKYEGSKFVSSAQQTLSVDGDQLSISEGNTITLPTGTASGSNIPILTSVQIFELTPESGESVFNTTESLYQIYTGSAWVSLPASCWPQPTTAYAGTNQTFNNTTTSTTLAANTPAQGHGTGQWSIISGEGGSFADDTDPATTFTGQRPQIYELQWAISTNCGISTDNTTISFIGGDGVTDEDGNTYSTVWFGNQEWMAENLRVTQYNNGEAIPTGLSNTDWGNTTDGAYAIYPHSEIDGLGSDAEVLEAYGKLYNWYAVETGNLCPMGWRVPTDAEWTALTDYSGGEIVAGGKLKSTRTAPDAYPRWGSPNTGAIDEYGFSALPGGHRYDNGTFDGLGSYGNWWSSTESSIGNAWHRGMLYNYSGVHRNDGSGCWGFSVRCVRDN